MYRYSHDTLIKAYQHIKNGGVIAYPTEYCYGLGCDPFNRKAIDKVLKLKRRSKVRGLIVIAGEIKQLKSLIKPLKQKAYDDIDKYWPGPFSLILETKKNVPYNLIGRHKKIAVRVTKHQLVKQLCQFIQMPLVSTSANISGYKPIKTYREGKKQFGESTLVLPGLTNFAKNPSTIIDWSTKKTLRSGL